ncbi:putative CRAL-TRIO lipid binding domain-containing protein [Helianthus anomalus]
MWLYTITFLYNRRNDEEMQQGEEKALFCTLCNVKVLAYWCLVKEGDREAPSFLFKLFTSPGSSKVEYEVLRLLGPEHSQITVLMDCGLSFFGILVKTLRSCVAFLQDHYPTRLGCLLVVWLPSIARVITQTQFQVSMFDFVLFSHHHFLFAIITERGQKHKG